jgi:hypothetical protein
MTPVAALVLAGVALLLSTWPTRAETENANPAPVSVYTIQTGELQGQQGQVFWGIQVEPKRVRLGLISPDVKTNVAVHLDLVNGRSLNITNVQCSSTNFEVATRVVAPGTNYIIDVSPKTPLPYGPIRESVNVTTDKPWRPVLKIPIDGKVTGEIDAVEWEIVVPYHKGALDIPRYVQIASVHKQPFNITQVLPPSDNVKVGKMWVAEDGKHIIQLTIHPDVTLNGQQLIVRTDVPSVPEIRIPFRVEVIPH